MSQEKQKKPKGAPKAEAAPAAGKGKHREEKVIARLAEVNRKEAVPAMMNRFK